MEAELLSQHAAAQARKARLYGVPKTVNNARALAKKARERRTIIEEHRFQAEQKKRQALSEAWLDMVRGDMAELRAGTDYKITQPNRLKIRKIVSATGKYFGYTPAQLLGASRNQGVCRARQIAMYLCHVLTGRSFPEIGRAVNRDHSTVMHGVKVIQGFLDKEDPWATEHVQALRRSI